MKARILSAEQIEQVRVMYVDTKLTLQQIGWRFRVTDRTISVLVTRHDWPRRTKAWKAGYVKPAAIPLPRLKIVVRPPSRDTEELEKAKTFLRKRGHVVFNAEIVDWRDKGLVQVDCRKWTPDRVLAHAAALSGAIL